MKAAICSFALASAGSTGLDDQGKAYATEPWKATFSVDLDGKPGGEQKQVTVTVHPDWAPEGAKRFQDLLEDGVLDQAKFFRVVPGFMAQFGIPADPAVSAQWHSKNLVDDPAKEGVSNQRGYLTYANS